MADAMAPIAKLAWLDAFSSEMREFPLLEGGSASIGRSATNDIQISEGHISRAHAVVTSRDGAFIIEDLDSVNGTFVNGERIDGAAPLHIGDDIHLFVSLLRLVDVRAETPKEEAAEMVAMVAGDRASLSIIHGPQKGHVFALLNEELVIGRLTPKASWEIALQDPTVSRPHAFLVQEAGAWKLFDLGSVNGTSVNSRPVSGGKARQLQDGDRVMLGATMMVFRVGYPAAALDDETTESEES